MYTRNQTCQTAISSSISPTQNTNNPNDTFLANCAHSAPTFTTNLPTPSLQSLPFVDTPHSINKLSPKSPTYIDAQPRINPTKPFDIIKCLNVNIGAGITNIPKTTPLHKNKHFQLQGFLKQHHIDVVFLQEIFLQHNKAGCTLGKKFMPGYNTYSTDKTAILWRQSMDKYINRVTVNLREPLHWATAIHIKLSQDTSIIAVSYYRSPSPSANCPAQFAELFQIMANLQTTYGKTSHIILNGDFNAHNTHWYDSYTDNTGTNLYHSFTTHDVWCKLKRT